MQPSQIILHHSLTRDSATVSWGAIRDYHVRHNGWSDIGYHFGIERLRNQIEILMGRFPNRSGAHCRGNNMASIGVCFVGNFDADPVPDDQWQMGVKLCQYLMKTFHIQTVHGHCEINPQKTCPGKLFNLNKFRKEIGL